MLCLYAKVNQTWCLQSLGEMLTYTVIQEKAVRVEARRQNAWYSEVHPIISSFLWVWGGGSQMRLQG